MGDEQYLSRIRQLESEIEYLDVLREACPGCYCQKIWNCSLNKKDILYSARVEGCIRLNSM